MAVIVYRTVADLLRATLFLSVVFTCSCQTATRPLTLSIEGSEGPILAELSFESIDPTTPFTERSIDVASGHTYTLHCMRSGGFDRGVTRVWHKDGTPVSLDTPERVHAIRDSNTWDLVIGSFSAGDVGRYSCNSSVGTLSLVISTANPAIISSTPYLTLNGGLQRSSSRPSLRVFVTGNPSPQVMNGSWVFNGTPTLPPSTVLLERDLVLGTLLTSEHSGIYRYTVTTSAGTETAQSIVSVIIEPAALIQPVMDQILAVGQSLNITCSDSVGVPPPTFTWKFNSQALVPNGDNVFISDDSNSTHRISRLDLRSLTVQRGGDYECVASNNPDPTLFSRQVLVVTVLRPPVPPEDIRATPTSPCTVEITWTTPPTSNSIAITDIVILEIQFVRNGLSEEWVELDRSPSPPLQAFINSRGPNTTYNLRGRGYNNMIGDGLNSMAYGTFFSYQDGEFPSIVNITGRPIQFDSILLSWAIETSMCYVYVNLSISCDSAGSSMAGSSMAVETEETSGVVTGLMADTEYMCSVTGVFTEAPADGVVQGIPMIQELSAVTVRTNTFPRVPPTPNAPRLDDTSTVSMDRFTATLESLPSDQDISHYHILVLRLSSPDALPMKDPDTLYPNSSSFSTCREVNVISRSDDAEIYQPYIAAEVSAAEFSTKFTVGGGGEADDTQELSHCNDKLIPGAVYTVFLRAYPVCESCLAGGGGVRAGVRARRQTTGTLQRQYDVFSSSSFLPAIVTSTGPGGPSPSSNGVMIIIICIVVVGTFLAIVLIVVICVLCYYRKTKTNGLTFSPSVDHSLASSDSEIAHYLDTPDLGGKRKNGIELKAMEVFADPMEVSFQPSGPIRGEDFSKHVEMFDARRQLLFTEEFEWIGKNSPWHTAEASNHPSNDLKNRYSNITAFDHSAVKLKPVPGLEHSDYINANYVAGYNKVREYIATQGPLDQTVEDFWRMIWEQHTSTIIMLTNLVELGKIKCSQYWPSSSKTMYGDIAVTLEGTLLFPDYTIRTLGVQSAKTNEHRRVLQFHYTKWPDYGTPNLAAPLLNFLKIVHESNDMEVKAGPMVVHCSAGVGRSGTVLTIDYCLQQLRRDGVADICKFVVSMREQRNYMVQTDQQYTFIHYAVLEAITYGDTSYDVKGFMKSYSKLQSASPSSSPNKVLLSEEFDRLGAVKTMVKKSSFQNRIKMKGAPQRHFHSSFHGGSASGSLQQCLGHFLDGYNQSNMFILTEGPEELTTMRFWEIVWDHNCSSIIMLSPPDMEELFCYWPESDSAEVQFGAIKVMVESESAEHLYTCRRIRLTNTKVEGISHQLMQYQFLGWTEQGLPRVPDFVSYMCDVINKMGVPSSDSMGKVLVHDLASVGPAGIFCSLFYSIQRLQIEKVVDIFQAVQMIQLQRPGCVSELEEYAFLYDCVYEFLIKNS